MASTKGKPGFQVSDSSFAQHSSNDEEEARLPIVQPSGFDQVPAVSKVTAKRHSHLRNIWEGAGSFFGPRKHGIARGVRYIRPNENYGSVEEYSRRLDSVVPESQRTETGRYAYTDRFGKVHHKYEDVDMYISTTTSEPRRLIVQATDQTLRTTTAPWRRKKIDGSVPLPLKITEWALAPVTPAPHEKTNPFGYFLVFGRVLVIALPLQWYMCTSLAPSWSGEDDVPAYFPDFNGYNWKWPKYAVNLLDQQPTADGPILSKHHTIADARPKNVYSTRVIKPRQLMVRTGLGENSWRRLKYGEYDQNIEYIFISYTTKHFSTNDNDPDKTSTDVIRDQDKITNMAHSVCRHYNISAYWMDFQCRAESNEKDLLTSDVNTMCDTIRGARFVVVMLPGVAADTHEAAAERERHMRTWGQRMWTLPEGLLASEKVRFCQARDELSFVIDEKSKIEMCGPVWVDVTPDGKEAEDSPTRLLSEHFSGVVTLSRLELFATAVRAFANREDKQKQFQRGDVAFALMGLLRYRILSDETDSLFQSLARLSLANDSDRLMERMLCMNPDEGRSASSARLSVVDTEEDLFSRLANRDIYGCHLWDIDPTVTIVGINPEPNSVMINGARAMPIRWKNFPTMQYRRHRGIKKVLAVAFLATATWWIVFGLNYIVTYAPLLLSVAQTTGGTFGSSHLVRDVVIVVVVFFGIGFALAVAAPFCVRRLYGGVVLDCTPMLVAFEGTMPIHKLEKLVFGNSIGRLRYETSSSIFAWHYASSRQGKEPDWIRDNRSPFTEPDVADRIPKNHRIFTLVDTGQRTITIFSAERPPTVALICGREGGSVRTLLCSWKHSTDTFFREAVIRLPHMNLERCTMKSWLKVCLSNQSGFAEALWLESDWLKTQREKRAMGQTFAAGLSQMDAPENTQTQWEGPKQPQPSAVRGKPVTRRSVPLLPGKESGQDETQQTGLRISRVLS